ncbi:MAG: SDR family oxidoreductase [Bacteroidota bacterium]
MNISLAGKNALVGGSTQGIGAATAHELAAQGARVTLLARNEESLKAKLASLPQPQGQAHDYLLGDFSQPEAVSAAVQAYLKEHEAFHILINNTGGPPGGPITQATPEQFLAAYHMHLLCNHLLAQAVLPGMKAAGYGRIINIISTSVKIPIDGLGVSNTTRGAVASWAKTLSNEVAAEGITVNNILPGMTATPRLEYVINNWASQRGISVEEMQEILLTKIPARRFADPAETAGVAAFLASPAASYVTGVSLRVDGGRTGSI